jgi:hypothetical protein
MQQGHTTDWLFEKTFRYIIAFFSTLVKIALTGKIIIALMTKINAIKEPMDTNGEQVDVNFDVLLKHTSKNPSRSLTLIGEFHDSLASTICAMRLMERKPGFRFFVEGVPRNSHVVSTSDDPHPHHKISQHAVGWDVPNSEELIIHTHIQQASFMIRAELEDFLHCHHIKTLTHDAFINLIRDIIHKKPYYIPTVIETQIETITTFICDTTWDAIQKHGVVNGLKTLLAEQKKDWIQFEVFDKPLEGNTYTECRYNMDNDLELEAGALSTSNWDKKRDESLISAINDALHSDINHALFIAGTAHVENVVGRVGELCSKVENTDCLVISQKSY